MADSVVATIDLYERGASDLAFDSKNGNMYVTHSQDNSVSVIDGKTNKVVGPPIFVGSNPGPIAFNPNNGYMYVVNSPPYKVSHVITSEYYQKPVPAAGSQMGSVSVIDTATNKPVGPAIKVLAGPSAIAFNSKNGYMYVLDSAGFSSICCLSNDGFSYFCCHVSVIDTTTNKVICRPSPPSEYRLEGSPCPGIGVGAWTKDIAFNSNSGDMYVSKNGGPEFYGGPEFGQMGIVVKDGTTNGMVQPPEGGELTIPIRLMGNITVWPMHGPGFDDNPPLVGNMAFNSANGKLYAIYVPTRSVVVIDSTTNKLVDSSIMVGHEPTDIAFNSANGKLYVTNRGDDTVSIIDSKTNKLVGPPIKVGNEPTNIAFNSANGNMYVVNEGDNTISVISPDRIYYIGEMTPPTVSITAPTESALIKSSTFEVSGIASDSSGLKTLEVQIDSQDFKPGSYGAVTAEGSTSWIFNTPKLTDGDHTIIAKATDNYKNSATTPPMTITVGSKLPLSLNGEGTGLIECRPTGMPPVPANITFETSSDETGITGSMNINITDATPASITGIIGGEKTFISDKSFELYGLVESDTHCASTESGLPRSPTLHIYGFIGNDLPLRLATSADGMELNSRGLFEGRVTERTP